MARREKKPVHKVVMTEGKRNIIQQLLQEYDIETAEDIQDALKDLLGGTIKEMMEAEMDDHLGYQKSERSDSDDYRNGYKSKRVNSSYGSMDIDVPQDRKSTFEPQIVKKRQKDISDIDQKIISMYAKGMTTRQISETIEDIYGFETSEGFISDVTDKSMPQIEDWQNRPLDEVYPILYIDAIHYSVRDNGVIRKLAAYVILGINTEGKKEVLSITVGDNESSKYWLFVLNELKNRGVKDILIICADGLSGIKEAIATAFPKTEYQRCIVHQVRNTLKYVSDKDRKAFASDLKTIYHEEYMQWGLRNYIYQISERMNNFGEYVVVIDKPEELISKIEKAVKRENYKFICGPVKYRKPKLNGKSARDGYSMTVKMDDMINLRDYSSSILNNRTCFDKMDKFSWQNEWRVILYRGEKSVEPYRLEIGNIRDICHWVTIDNLENEIKCCLENGVIKNKINGYYGNASKDEVRELFCELGENKAELLAVIG